MNRIVLMIVFALICGIVLTNCSTDKLSNDVEIEGVYIGIYTTTNLTRGSSWNNTATIELKGGKYTYSGLSDGSLSDIYDISGNYSISNNKIIFELINYDGPLVDLVVIEGFAVLLLEGEYSYKFDEGKLLLSKVVTSLPEEYSCEFELYGNR